MKKIVYKMKGLIIGELFFHVLLVIGVALVPYAEKEFIELFTQSNLTIQAALRVILIFIAAVVLYVMSNYVSMQLVFKECAAFEMNVRDEYIRGLIGEKKRWFSEAEKDEHIQNLSVKITQLEDDYLRPSIEKIGGILHALTYIVFMTFMIDPLIALGITILAVVGVVCPQKVKSNASEKREKYLSQNAVFMGTLRHLITGFSTIRSNNKEYVIKAVETEASDVAKKRIKYGAAKGFLLCFYNGISYVLMLLFFVYVVVLAYKGWLTVSVAVVSFGFIDLMMEPLNMVLDSTAKLKSSEEMVQTFNKQLVEVENAQYNGNSVEQIEFSDVTCERGKVILEHYSTKLDLNKNYLIKGMNGAGKSTLLRIIAGSVGCTGGELRINGKTRKDELYEDIYYVEQNAVVFPVPFVENVSMFGAYDVKKLDKYDFMNESVFKKIQQCNNCEVLSGGEKQLVSLCRALICGARVLLLDETFSGVNSMLEKKVVEELVKSEFHIIYVSHTTTCDSMFEQIRLGGC